MRNQGTPPGGTFGGPSQPGEKKGLSRGCVVGIVAAVVLAVGGAVLLIAAGVGGYFFYSRGAANSSNAAAGGTAAPAGRAGPSSPSSSGDAAAEAPSPTEAQRAAVAGGQTAAWAQQEISWTVPQRWSSQSETSNQFHWRSPGSSDAANLIVSISPMAADFPWETANDAAYQQAQTRRASGEVNEVRWVRLGGLRGVTFRESAPESDDDPQRLQWIGYRNYKGQVQYVNIMLATRGKDFARHEDALYGVLYTTTFGQ